MICRGVCPARRSSDFVLPRKTWIYDPPIPVVVLDIMSFLGLIVFDFRGTDLWMCGNEEER